MMRRDLFTSESGVKRIFAWWTIRNVACGQRSNVAHDRCSHGRSDLAGMIAKLDLKNIIVIRHSAGGGEVTR
jgi:hypothetical protein